MDCFIGLDIGTSAVKGVVLSKDGEIISQTSCQFTYNAIKTAFLLDPNEFIDVCFSVIKNLLSSLNGDEKVVAICPSCASGNLLLLDEQNKPITSIISWRSTVNQQEIESFFSDNDKKVIYETVGWPVLQNFPLAYLLWFSLHSYEMINRSKMICMSAEYLNYKMTGKWGISYSMATPFYLLNQESGSYNEHLLKKLKLKKNQLPPIYQNGTVIGTLTTESANFLGLTSDVEIVLGSFDHPSNAIGSGVFKPGDVLISCGTSWVEFFPITDRKKAIENGFLVDRFMIDGTPYCAMKSIPSLSLKITAIKEFYLGTISHKEFDQLVTKSRIGCNGLKFSFNDDDYKIANECNKADIARAIYESAAYLLKANLLECQNNGFSVDRIVMVGGVTNSSVCVKVISEILQQKITIVNGVLAGAIGAAILAAIGKGCFQNEMDAFFSMNFKKTSFDNYGIKEQKKT